MKFYLGANHPNWLWGKQLTAPLFVSRRTLSKIKTLGESTVDWCLDSGGFTEVAMRGGWTTTPEQYVSEARRYMSEIGRMQWAAPQDWMCEPVALRSTGKTIVEHQRLTVENFLRLRSMAPDVPFVPVLQGWEPDDYLRCVDLYSQAGIDLERERTVGLGTVCRRHHTQTADYIVRRLQPLRLHGFGVKADGLVKFGHLLQSADSMAWSFAARRSPPMPGHETRHKACNNCVDYALMWRSKLLRRLDGAPQQLFLLEECYV